MHNVRFHLNLDQALSGITPLHLQLRNIFNIHINLMNIVFICPGGQTTTEGEYIF